MIREAQKSKEVEVQRGQRPRRLKSADQPEVEMNGKTGEGSLREWKGRKTSSKRDKFPPLLLFGRVCEGFMPDLCRI